MTANFQYSWEILIPVALGSRKYLEMHHSQTDLVLFQVVSWKLVSFQVDMCVVQVVLVHYKVAALE